MALRRCFCSPPDFIRNANTPQRSLRLVGHPQHASPRRRSRARTCNPSDLDVHRVRVGPGAGWATPGPPARGAVPDPSSRFKRCAEFAVQGVGENPLGLISHGECRSSDRGVQHRARVRSSVGADAEDLEMTPVIEHARDWPPCDGDTMHDPVAIADGNRELVADSWAMMSMVLRHKVVGGAEPDGDDLQSHGRPPETWCRYTGYIHLLVCRGKSADGHRHVVAGGGTERALRAQQPTTPQPHIHHDDVGLEDHLGDHDPRKAPAGCGGTPVARGHRGVAAHDPTGGPGHAECGAWRAYVVGVGAGRRERSALRAGKADGDQRMSRAEGARRTLDVLWLTCRR